jgi:hypothetical protein
LTYTAVVHPGSLRGLTHENACGAASPSIKLRPGTRNGKHSQVLSFAIAWVGYLSGAVPSWELLGVSIIGTGGVSPAPPSRFERLTH